MTDKQSKEKALIEEIMSQREAIEAPCEGRQYRVLTRLATNPDNHFVVSLGAGAAHGLAGNCALVALLDELGLKDHVKEVWGCSAGAVVGSGWCADTPIEQVMSLIEGLSQGGVDIPKWELLVKGIYRLFVRRQLPPGLILGRRFRKTILAGQRAKNIEDCRIPFRVVACTDDGHAKKVVFRDGSMIDAVCASMCIPGVLFPVEDWKGEPHGYFDGGVVEKTPLVSIIEEHARQVRSSQLVILCTHFDSSARITRPEGFVQRFLSILDHLEDVVWQHDLATARQHPNCKFMVLNPRMEIGSMLDFHLTRVMYLWARKVYKEQLSNANLAARFDAR